MRAPSLLAAALLLTACSLSGPSVPPYMVYFQERSTQLDPRAHDVIVLAAQRAKEAPRARVTVTGYTDSAGSPPADVQLSRDRARIVADSLVANGVAATRIARIGAGQTNEDPGVASRRVEIAVGG